LEVRDDAVPVKSEENDRGVVDESAQGAQPAVALPQRLPGLAPFPPDLAFPKLPLDSRGEASQRRQRDTVVGARLDRLDRGLLADLLGDDDERQVRLPLLQERESLQRSKAADAVVGQDDVPGPGGKRLIEGLAGIHALEGGLETAP